MGHVKKTKLKTFKKYNDPGHGWLAVKQSDLLNVGLTLGDISEVSYISKSKKTVYLEEDSDAQKFIVAFEKKYGCSPLIQSVYTNGHDRSFVRNLQYIGELY